MKLLELAGAVILDNEKRILLMHRNTDELKQWELPGGKLEKGETPEQTAKRELKEELNVELDIVKYVGFKEFEDNNCILKYHWYLSDIKEQIPTLMEEKFDNIHYFSKKELLKMNDLSSNMKKFLNTIDIDTL